MYTSSINFTRTQEERTNQLLAWQRSDKAFFAAGACHVLAFTFKTLHPERQLEIIYIKPAPEFNMTGSHVYVRDGEWAFDFNGWTKEQELLDITEQEYQKQYPGWSYETITITDDLETFCRDNQHRPPAYFAQLPWERAYRYISLFSPLPPS